MVLSLREFAEAVDFLDHLRRLEARNQRVLTALEIQKLEREHKELVMNYFMYHQQSNTIVEYESSFLELKRWAETWNEEKFDEKWVVSIFVKGLKEEIKDYVKLYCPDSLQRAIVLAKWGELSVADKVFVKRAERDTTQDALQLGKLIEEAKVIRNNGKEAGEESATNCVKDNIGCLISFNAADNLNLDSVKLDKQAFDAKQKVNLIFPHPVHFVLVYFNSGLKVFDVMPGKDENSWIFKLKENGLYWGERGKIESTGFYSSHFLKPFLLNYDGCTMIVGCNFWCLGDVNELRLQEFCLEEKKYMEVVHKSMGLLTQNFIILFLWSNVEIIFLGKAAMRTKVWRLCVIVNELSYMNFIEKTHHSDSRTLTLRWLGLGGPFQSAYVKDPILCFKKRRFRIEFENTGLIKCKVVPSVDAVVGLAKKTQLQTQAKCENLANLVMSNIKESLRHNYQLGPYAPIYVPKASIIDNTKVKLDCDCEIGKLEKTEFRSHFMNPHLLNNGSCAALLYSQKKKKILLKLGSTNGAFQVTYAWALRISMNTYGLILFSSTHAPFHPTFSFSRNIFELCILRLVSKCSSSEGKSWDALKHTLGCIRVQAFGPLPQIEAMIVGEGYTGHEVGAVTEINNLEVTIRYPDPWCMFCLFTVDIISLCKRYNTNKDVQIIKGTVAVGVPSGANGEVKEVYFGNDNVPIAAIVVVRIESRQLMELFKVHVGEQQQGMLQLATISKQVDHHISFYAFSGGIIILQFLSSKYVSILCIVQFFMGILNGINSHIRVDIWENSSPLCFLVGTTNFLDPKILDGFTKWKELTYVIFEDKHEWRTNVCVIGKCGVVGDSKKDRLKRNAETWNSIISSYVHKAKGGGWDVILTHLLWSKHEPSVGFGEQCFERMYYLVWFIELVQQTSLYVHLQIGSYVCISGPLGELLVC